MKTPLLTLLMLSLISLSSVSAMGLPISSPDGITPVNGIFATYFQNIATAPSCPAPLVITGFDSTPGANFLKPLCSEFGNSLGGFLMSQTQPVGNQVIQKFNPTGTPQYLDINTVISAHLAWLPVTPPWQVVWWFGTGGVPIYVQGSPWAPSGINNIYFTGGNVSIGTTISPAKLTIMETIAGLTTGIQISGQHTLGVTAW
jgi:hypothetical protein